MHAPIHHSLHGICPNEFQLTEMSDIDVFNSLNPNFKTQTDRPVVAFTDNAERK